MTGGGLSFEHEDEPPQEEPPVEEAHGPEDEELKIISFEGIEIDFSDSSSEEEGVLDVHDKTVQKVPSDRLSLPPKFSPMTDRDEDTIKPPGRSELSDLSETDSKRSLLKAKFAGMKFGGEPEQREEEQETEEPAGSKKFTLKKKTSLPSGSSKGMPARRLKKI